MRILCSSVLGLFATVAIAYAGSATVRVDTSLLVGNSSGPFSIGFQLADGGGTGDGNNAVTVSNFQFGSGSPTGTATVSGTASGNLSSTVAMTDLSQFNVFTQPFSPGNTLSFTLNFTNNTDTGTPDEFVFTILDNTGTPVPTTGGSALIQINFNSANPTVQTFAGDPTQLMGTGAAGIAIPAPAVPQPSAPLQFYPITPCRIADTRSSQPFTGAFGPPSLAAYSQRIFPILSSTCGVPGAAQAYSLNFTAVPQGPLSFLSAWPTGQSYPGVSVLNSTDGSVIANAAIVPAGTGGSITVVTGNPSDLIIDINGYFAAPGASGLDFFPVTPCRIADTRTSEPFTGAFGPPSLRASATRDFPIGASPCLPSPAQAYSLNFTVVPPGPESFLTAWPTGLGYPGVSTLNAPDGTVLANAAFVPAGTNGDINVVAGNPTDLIIDVNGTFAAPASGGLHFYAITPCRITDTRASQSFAGDFGPPGLTGYVSRDFPVLSSSCGVPASAQAYALNITAVPQGPLSFLSIWPTGQTYPGVSTLNSTNGAIIANAAVVPAGTNGAVTVISGNPTDLILDIVGYFAP